MKRAIWTTAVLGWVSVAQATFVVDVPVDQAIPDGDAAGLASWTTVTGQTDPVGSLKVNLHMSGSYNGDLYAYLTHDSGFVVLLNRVGRTGSAGLGYGDSGINVTFADGTVNGDVHLYRQTLFGNPNLALEGPLTGTWRADGRNVSPYSVSSADSSTALLSSFAGVDPNGQWTLFVADVSAGEVHTLKSWGLEMVALPEASSYLVSAFLLIPCCLEVIRGWRLRRSG